MGTQLFLMKWSTNGTWRDLAVTWSPFGEWRCEGCRRLLAKANEGGGLAGIIKCPRCGEKSER